MSQRVTNCQWDWKEIKNLMNTGFYYAEKTKMGLQKR
jgi:hypothetical protein